MIEGSNAARRVALPPGAAQTVSRSRRLLALLVVLALAIFLLVRAGNGYGRPGWWVAIAMPVVILILGALAVSTFAQVLVCADVLPLATVTRESGRVWVHSRRRAVVPSRIPVPRGSRLTLEVWSWDLPVGTWPLRRTVRMTGARLLHGEALALSFAYRGDLADIDWEEWAKEVGGDDFDVVVDVVGDATIRS